MILGKDTHPTRNIYYLGSVVLGIIKSSSKDKIDFFDTFQKLNEKEKVSMNLYTLTLDWLFLLGAIKNNNGRFEKCF
jgi:hypothetical protein